MLVSERTVCRLCGGRLDPVLQLGDFALAAFPLPGDPPTPTAPLDVVICASCRLVQLRHTVARDQLYRHYWYRSGINEAMRTELTSVVSAALLTVSLYSDDVVLDVGANDGFLLSQYQAMGRRPMRIAFEPAYNLSEAVGAHAEVVIGDYFPQPVVLPDEWQRVVKILTSIACVYDIDDPLAFVREVDRLLHPDGVWIVQFQDLAQMIAAIAFDNICHEHLTYWSLTSFTDLLDRSGTDLQVTHVERRAINGGSLRILVRRRFQPADQTVEPLLAAERPLLGWQALDRFAWRVREARKQIQGAVQAVADRTVDLYGASTKGNTLCQFVGLGPDRIRQAWERNPDKVGRLTATGVPIVSEEVGRADPPDLLVPLIWQFRESLLQREAAYLAGGGRILFPLPVVDLVQGVQRHAAPPPL